MIKEPETLREEFRKDVELLREEKHIEREQQLAEMKELKEMVRSLTVGKSPEKLGENSRLNRLNKEEPIIKELLSEEKYYSEEVSLKKDNRRRERNSIREKPDVENQDPFQNYV